MYKIPIYESCRRLPEINSKAAVAKCVKSKTKAAYLFVQNFNDLEFWIFTSLLMKQDYDI